MAKPSEDDDGSEFSLSDEEAASDHSARATASDSASFETDSELSDDPLGEYDDADDDSYEQRRHKYQRGEGTGQSGVCLHAQASIYIGWVLWTMLCTCVALTAHC